ncbi:MAG: filamentous hemagglutinin N-terminal domain-containing protein [Rhizonema sp. NSF051]|nr:filamentous hemagglutinin N-terminal domain-containing protein [Rhizonema sp. NSF051]
MTDALFHSFREFNVNNGQQVYFAPPNGVTNIFTRVTGSNISRIFGTLGVNGGANLFFMNPNGIIFGANARLDLRGSFTATTANRINFDKYTFSANNPTTPPLLKINVTPGLQYGAIDPEGRIRSEGNLSVGQDLNLIGGNLNLQAQLGAGQNINVVGDTVNIRDSTNKPFIATAGRNLHLQGNKTVNISALNHPNSSFNAGGDLVLESFNPVLGDARFTVGGSFSIKQPDGNLGNLVSPNDPIIQASGDVTFDTYSGTSLHILAGGAININNITITGADTTGNTINPTTIPIQANVTLSDGTPVVVNGTARPTLDLRAGTTAVVNSGTSGSNYTTLTPVENTTVATSANITIGSITVSAPNGQVLLTNQYQPKALSTGNIQVNSIDTSSTVGRGGDILLDSRSNIILPPSGLLSSSSGAGNSGNITLIANNAISVANNATIQSSTFPNGFGNAGNINVTAQSLSFDSGAFLTATTFAKGNGGQININARDAVSLTGTSTGIFSSIAFGAEGNGGDININTRSLTLSDGARVSAGVLGNWKWRNLGGEGSAGRTNWHLR